MSNIFCILHIRQLLTSPLKHIIMKDNLTDEMHFKIGKAIVKAFILGVILGSVVTYLYLR